MGKALFFNHFFERNLIQKYGDNTHNLQVRCHPGNQQEFRVDESGREVEGKLPRLTKLHVTARCYVVAWRSSASSSSTKLTTSPPPHPSTTTTYSESSSHDDTSQGARHTCTRQKTKPPQPPLDSLQMPLPRTHETRNRHSSAEAPQGLVQRRRRRRRCR